MTDSRQAISRTVSEVPGIHYNGLVRRVDLAPGQIQYHLRALLREGTIVRLSLYGRTHYFPPEYDRCERGALALCHRETARDILLYLLEAGPSRPTAVVDSLEIARSTLEWHLDHLVEQGLVEKRRDGRNQVTLSLVRPRATLELLCEIEPTLPERLTDRFTRLVDRLLSE